MDYLWYIALFEHISDTRIQDCLEHSIFIKVYRFSRIFASMKNGCDGALEIAKDLGKPNVTIVEMMDDFARDAMFINKISLTNALNDSGVKIITGAKVTSITEDSVIIETKDGNTETLNADTVISAFGMKPDMEIVDQIDAKYHLKTRKVGDSKQLGKIGDAVRTGFYAALSL